MGANHAPDAPPAAGPHWGGSRYALAQLPPYQSGRDAVVTPDERRQVDVEQVAVPDTDASVDDAEVDGGRLAEDDRGERVVDRAAREGKRVETVADEVSSHAGREVANVVAA